MTDTTTENGLRQSVQDLQTRFPGSYALWSTYIYHTGTSGFGALISDGRWPSSQKDLDLFMAFESTPNILTTLSSKNIFTAHHGTGVDLDIKNLYDRGPEKIAVVEGLGNLHNAWQSGLLKRCTFRGAILIDAEILQTIDELSSATTGVEPRSNRLISLMANFDSIRCFAELGSEKLRAIYNSTDLFPHAESFFRPLDEQTSTYQLFKDLGSASIEAVSNTSTYVPGHDLVEVAKHAVGSNAKNLFPALVKLLNVDPERAAAFLSAENLRKMIDDGYPVIANGKTDRLDVYFQLCTKGDIEAIKTLDSCANLLNILSQIDDPRQLIFKLAGEGKSELAKAVNAIEFRTTTEAAFVINEFDNAEDISNFAVRLGKTPAKGTSGGSWGENVKHQRFGHGMRGFPY